jgi:hypothetical protein
MVVEKTSETNTRSGACDADDDPSAAVADLPQRWFACCDRVDHPSGSTWTGAKRSSRREAIKDSVAHNKAFAHNSVVVGPNS